jgi:hypothetical protein
VDRSGEVLPVERHAFLNVICLGEPVGFAPWSARIFLDELSRDGTDRQAGIRWIDPQMGDMDFESARRVCRVGRLPSLEMLLTAMTWPRGLPPGEAGRWFDWEGGVFDPIGSPFWVADPVEPGMAMQFDPLLSSTLIVPAQAVGRPMCARLLDE